MEYTQFITDDHRKVLERARSTYGYTKQLSVCSEELNELAIVCNKHCRYDTSDGATKALHDAALTEVADVLVILDHVVNIFDIKEDELANKIAEKVARLNRWLNKTDSLEQSTKDRELTAFDVYRSCDTCSYRAVPRQVGPCKECGPDRVNYHKAMACKGCTHYGTFSNLSPGGVCYICVKDGGSQFKSKGETD